MKPPSPSAKTPCDGYEVSCLEAAWESRDDPAWAAHRAGCSRCREALADEIALRGRCAEGGAGAVPADVLRGFPQEVFARTTRREAPLRRPRVWAWAGLGGAVATAAVALLALYVAKREPAPEALELAEVELELLENLDLAENLPILEILDALEEMDDV